RSKRDWSSDVCSSDLAPRHRGLVHRRRDPPRRGAAGEPVVSSPAGFLNAFAHALAAMTLYRPGHPARERAIDDAYRELSDLQARSEERRVGKECRDRW